MRGLTIIHDELRAISRPNNLPEMLNIGLTGGMGSGKSSVAQLLKRHRAAVVDVDAIARELTQSNGVAMVEIEAVFGQRMLQKDGSLDRARMRTLIFDDAFAKLKLEKITHPLIFQKALKTAHEYSLALPQPSFLIYDIPLLYGNDLWLKLLDWIVVVVCRRQERVRRVLKRNRDYTQEYIESVMDAQAADEQLFEVADVLLDNSQTEENNLQLINSTNILSEHMHRMLKLKSILMYSNELKL